ncbi:glycoside hydrolase [Dyella caseinilytica]|uniref:Glycoside hydrolase n=1 Tax=Dyella caseinilytica TaxID=1849581 RepID=A0ABX7GV87_9GAMM|nr:glycoside hydrolase [Dyella caseinilytica]QRN53868.1 glycoside hydrolase [Dyella caseinilytica]GFZ89732.1 hypothetical protein GCM10011408_05960 [Dyella caseinilytica]
MLAALGGISGTASADLPASATIRIGAATVVLNGPWKFSTGDDLGWAAPDVDDSHWETVDLTPAPGAHDGDVGLPGYVSGWSMRGHPGYIGYAWYRLRVTVDDDHNTPLAVAGPTDVDSTYQLYVDGKLLGGSGRFSGKTPTVYSVQPSVYPLTGVPAGTRTYVIALRVWMDPGDAGEDSGGIHIAPTLGTLDGVTELHEVQWLQTFKGYVVDAAEPMAFVLLAILVFALMACRSRDAYRWLVVALLLTACLRVNQVLFYWTHYESLRTYDVATAVLLTPLTLAAWVMAWRDWFGLKPSRWLSRTVLVLTLVYVLFALVGRPWFAPAYGWATAANFLVMAVRLIFAALYLCTVGYGLLRQLRFSTCLAALTAVLMGIGLFARELSSIGLQGIWFPYGVGVSRTQYAYAGFSVLLFVLLLMRFIRYARAKWY